MTRALLLLLLLPCAAAALPLPTRSQSWYEHGEIHALVHFNMATFARDGDPGCAADNWNKHAHYAVGPTSDPGTFRPAKLNVSQWADVMVGLGARGAILTAKHGCGHLLWPTKTTLPNGKPYGYNVGRPKVSYIQDDVLALFSNAMSARGIRHGFYYSLTNNWYLNVAAHAAGARADPLPGQVNVSQAEFEALALAQLTELWSNYGDLGEIWFDGGYTSDMSRTLEKILRRHQPHAVGFGGCSSDTNCISSNPATWVGTESGEPVCDDIWSTGNLYCGDPDSPKYVPKTCDTTLQEGDHWFWTPPATAIRNLTTMIDVYHATVGKNGIMEIDFAIDRDGLVAAHHEAVYRKLGAWIRGCYGGAPAGGMVASRQINATAWEYTVAVTEPGVVVDRAVLREDTAKGGQRVRAWSLTMTASGTLLHQAKSIGNRRAVLFGSTLVAPVNLTLTVSAVAEPEWAQVGLFAPCPKP